MSHAQSQLRLARNTKSPMTQITIIRFLVFDCRKHKKTTCAETRRRVGTPRRGPPPNVTPECRELRGKTSERRCGSGPPETRKKSPRGRARILVRVVLERQEPPGPRDLFRLRARMIGWKGKGRGGGMNMGDCQVLPNLGKTTCSRVTRQQLVHTTGPWHVDRERERGTEGKRERERQRGDRERVKEGERKRGRAREREGERYTFHVCPSHPFPLPHQMTPSTSPISVPD